MESVTISIPKEIWENILSEKIEERLKQDRIGTIWDMKRLCKEWSHSDEWIKNNYLYEMRDRGIAIKTGNKWLFKAQESRDFINQWFIRKQYKGA